MSSKTVLVTGAFGFLGRAVGRCFKREGFRVVGMGHGHWDPTDAYTHGIDRWVNSTILLSSLTNLEETFDVVVHCAGSGSVGYSITNPLQDFNKSVGSTIELLEYIRLNLPDAVLIYPSSAGVYGAKEDAPIRETDHLNPISPYGFHKKISEECCESYSRNFGLNIKIIRFFSIYGPGLMKQLLWDALGELLANKSKVELWGTGEETRDWIHVNDASALILEVSRQPPSYEVYNGANGDRLTITDILTLLKENICSPPLVSFNGLIRPGDPRFYHADVSGSKKIGWTPRIPLEAGIKEYLTWYRNFKNA